eukprot:scaffold2044_cov305-Pavlova_lutheri.AAC.21
MPFHRALETFPNRGARDINVLPGHEVCRIDLCAHGQKSISGDLELRQLPLDGHLLLGVMSQECPGDLLLLLAPYAHLEGIEPVLFLRLHLRHVALVDPQHGDRSSHSPFVPEAHHPALDRHYAAPS